MLNGVGLCCSCASRLRVWGLAGGHMAIGSPATACPKTVDGAPHNTVQEEWLEAWITRGIALSCREPLLVVQQSHTPVWDIYMHKTRQTPPLFLAWTWNLGRSQLAFGISLGFKRNSNDTQNHSQWNWMDCGSYLNACLRLCSCSYVYLHFAISFTGIIDSWTTY